MTEKFLEEILSEEEWLKDSEFYTALDKNLPINILNIPYCSKYTTDIIKFLEMINFWGVSNIPFEFYDLVLESKPIEKLQELYDVTNSDFYKFLLDIFNVNKNEYIEFIKYLRSKNYEWKNNTCLCAAENNHLECLKYLYENGSPFIAKNICFFTIKNGNLECFKFSYEILKKLKKDSDLVKRTLIEEVARGGYLNCLIFLEEQFNIIKHQDIVNICLEHEHLDCIKYLSKKNYQIPGDFCQTAAEIGNLEILKYGHEEGYGLPIYTTYVHLKDENLNCIKYLYENGCRLSKDTIDSCVEHGNLEGLIYLCENECPFNSYTFKCAVSSGNIECLKFLTQIGIKKNILWDKYAIEEAARLGNIEMLKFFHGQLKISYNKNYLLEISKIHCKKFIIDYY